MRCLDLVEQLDDYSAGNLSRWENLGVQFHLLICSNCRKYVASYDKTVVVAHGLGLHDAENAQLSEPQVVAITKQVVEVCRTTSSDDTSPGDPSLPLGP